MIQLCWTVIFFLRFASGTWYGHPRKPRMHQYDCMFGEIVVARQKLVVIVKTQLSNSLRDNAKTCYFSDQAFRRYPCLELKLRSILICMTNKLLSTGPLIWNNATFSTPIRLAEKVSSNGFFH